MVPGCGWGELGRGLWAFLGTPHSLLPPDESALKMDHVAHVPQSPASHVVGRLPQEVPRADMLRPDPRDTFFLSEQGPVGVGVRAGRRSRRPQREHLSHSSPRGAFASGGRAGALCLRPHLRGQGLPHREIPGAAVCECPSQTLPEPRLPQGARSPSAPDPACPQVYLSFVYPNDHTRLTHMETDNKCFYRESPLYLERWVGRATTQEGAGPLRGGSSDPPPPPRPRFGFYKYMKMDRQEGEGGDEEEVQRRAFLFLSADGECPPHRSLRPPCGF